MIRRQPTDWPRSVTIFRSPLDNAKKPGGSSELLLSCVNSKQSLRGRCHQGSYWLFAFTTYSRPLSLSHIGIPFLILFHETLELSLITSIRATNIGQRSYKLLANCGLRSRRGFIYPLGYTSRSTALQRPLNTIL